MCASNPEAALLDQVCDDEAHVPDLRGCIAAGETKEEVLSLIREAIEFHIEGLKQEGQPIPAPGSMSELVDVEAA